MDINQKNIPRGTSLPFQKHHIKIALIYSRIDQLSFSLPPTAFWPFYCSLTSPSKGDWDWGHWVWRGKEGN